MTPGAAKEAVTEPRRSASLPAAPVAPHAATRTRRVPPSDPRLLRLKVNAADLIQRMDTAAAGHHEPDEETVHRLRTGTRRCGALLESLLHDAGRNPLITQEKAARKLLRQWKLLRRAAGSVRDLDVHITQLKQLRKRLVKEADPGIGEQIEQFQSWLVGQRASRAQKLHEVAARRVEKCRSLALTVLGDNPAEADSASSVAATPAPAGPPRRLSAQTAPALLALEDFYAVSQVNALLNRDNLHDFRKSTKEARYVAEAGGDEEHAVAVSKALKRIQDCVGDWHDLDALCLEAAQALGAGGMQLRVQLEQLAEARLQQAIAEAEKMRRRLLGERLALQPTRPRVTKSPPPQPVERS